MTGGAYALRNEDDENAAASAYARIGSFAPVRATLSSAGQRTLLLRLTHATRRRFCRSAHRQDTEAAEITVAIRDAATGTRQIVLGEEPTSQGCDR